MKLVLQKDIQGTHFAICVVGERTRKQIVIPLSPDLSAAIERLVRAEGVPIETVLLRPGMH